MSWYQSEPRNLTFADVEQQIRAFVSGQSAIGSFSPRTIPFDAVNRPIVSYLPLQPNDGDEVRFLADADAGTLWLLRYRAAADGLYRWEFLGGSHLTNVETGSTTRAVSAYGDLAAGASPTFTLALPGDYIIDVGATLQPGSAGFGAFASFSVNAATASDDDAAVAYFGSGTNPGQVSVMNRSYKTGLAAGTTIQQKFKAQGASSATITGRFISITPIRVGRA